jgi:hypothetical protein
MAKKEFGPEQVVAKLRQIEVLMGEGDVTGSFCTRLRDDFSLSEKRACDAQKDIYA